MPDERPYLDPYLQAARTHGPGFEALLTNFGATFEVVSGLKVYGSFAQGFSMADVGRVLRAIKGNAMDMAVGVIIGGAFTAIVTSLTDDIINPLLKLVLPSSDASVAEVSRSWFASMAARTSAMSASRIERWALAPDVKAGMEPRMMRMPPWR